jgi:hypothetical protein
VTYFSNQIPHLPIGLPIDGVALLNATYQMAVPNELPIIAVAQPGMPAPTTESMRQPAAAVIQRCYRWLEAAVPILPQVAALVPVLVTAIHQYEAEQYAVCLQQAMLVAQTAQRLNANAPALPAL